MHLVQKRFEELTLTELYEILKLRVNVFVVEQNCPYPELDDRDQKAIHLWFEEDGRILVYLRVMDRGVENERVSMGRFVSAERRKGLGEKLLLKGIRCAREAFSADEIYIEAQVYVKHLYERNGFIQVSDEFLEDGIPHIKMILPPKKEGAGV